MGYRPIPVVLKTALLSRQSYAGVASLSVALPPEMYSRLLLYIRSDAASTFTGGVYSLTGLTGAYKKQTLYALGGAAAGIVTTANWNNDDIPGAPAVMDGWIDIRTGGYRQGVLDARHDNVGTPVWRHIWVANDDTVNTVAGFSMTFTGGTFTGFAEFKGIP